MLSRRWSSNHHVPGFGAFTGPVGPATQSQIWVRSTPLVGGSEFDVIVIGGGHAGMAFIASHLHFLTPFIIRN